MDLSKPPKVGTHVLIMTFGFEQNKDESYVYKKCEWSVVMFLILYVDDILLAENDGVLSIGKI